MGKKGVAQECVARCSTNSLAGDTTRQGQRDSGEAEALGGSLFPSTSDSGLVREMQMFIRLFQAGHAKSKEKPSAKKAHSDEVEQETHCLQLLLVSFPFSVRDLESTSALPLKFRKCLCHRFHRTR